MSGDGHSLTAAAADLGPAIVESAAARQRPTALVDLGEGVADHPLPRKADHPVGGLRGDEVEAEDEQVEDPLYRHDDEALERVGFEISMTVIAFLRCNCGWDPFQLLRRRCFHFCPSSRALTPVTGGGGHYLLLLCAGP